MSPSETLADGWTSATDLCQGRTASSNGLSPGMRVR